jgi:P-type Mg2+ transporter
MNIAWAKPEDNLLTELNSSEKGLSSLEADKRWKREQNKLITAAKKRSALSIFFAQFKNALILVLIACAILSFFLGEGTDGSVILFIVIANAFLGFFQENKTNKILEELKKYIKIKSKVLRSAQIISIDSDKIVTGDIIYFNIGDIVPADIRLLKSDNLSANESALTGESIPTSKMPGTADSREILPQKLSNMLFMGTSIAGGTGYGVVTSIGEDTFFGKTSEYLQESAVEGNYQKSIRRFSNFLLKVIIIMTAAVFICNAALGKGLFISFLFAIALAVGITPEALPVIMTITLSQGASRMAAKQVLSKSLGAIENLGSMNVLCCDKTGTLTVGEPSLIDFVNTENQRDLHVLQYGALCNTNNEHSLTIDNPLDRAIAEYYENNNIEASSQIKVIDTNEFDFQRRRISVLVSSPEGNELICKGAPESILSVSAFAGKEPLTEGLKKDLYNRIHKYEEDGYKVIAIASKATDLFNSSTDDEQELSFMGFLLFLDPAKETVYSSLRKLEEQGVEIKIISGDSPHITKRICSDIGLEINKSRIITGDDLNAAGDKQFKEFALEYNVFARVTPEQKLNLVKALTQNGKVVGFLGDGINDAPALKAADIGISVDTAAGIAKEAGDIILLRKSLGVLSEGITEGRKAFANMNKYLLNSISSNFGNMFTVAIASLFLPFIPLLPAQILLNNLLSDFPMVMISTDNVDASSLKKPQSWNLKFISHFMISFGLISTIFDLIIIFFLIYLWHENADDFRSSWFIYSITSELVVMFAIRTMGAFFRSRPGKWLVAMSALIITVAFILPFTKPGQLFFSFTEPNGKNIMPMLIIVLLYLFAVEVAKFFFYKRFGPRKDGSQT